MLSILLCGAAVSLAACRLVVAPFSGVRPATRSRTVRRITVSCSRAILQVLDIRVQVVGRPNSTPALLACNHLSWLDILVMHTVFPAADFIAKDDVADWPIIGPAARAVGTVFVARNRKRDLLRAIPAVATTMQDHGVVLFAEGTTTDGSHTLPFKSSLFESAVRARVPVVPVSLRAIVPAGAPSVRTHVAWWGSATLLEHLPRVAGLPYVTFVVRVGDPLRAMSAPRKLLGRAAHHAVARQAGHTGVVNASHQQLPGIAIENVLLQAEREPAKSRTITSEQIPAYV